MSIIQDALNKIQRTQQEESGGGSMSPGGGSDNRRGGIRNKPLFFGFMAALLALGVVMWLWLDTIQKRQIEAAALMAKNMQANFAIAQMTHKEKVAGETTTPTDGATTTPAQPVAPQPAPPPPAEEQLAGIEATMNTLRNSFYYLLAALPFALGLLAFGVWKRKSDERSGGGEIPHAAGGTRSFRLTEGSGISGAFIGFSLALLVMGAVAWLWLDSVQRSQLEAARMLAQSINAKTAATVGGTAIPVAEAPETPGGVEGIVETLRGASGYLALALPFAIGLYLYGLWRRKSGEPARIEVEESTEYTPKITVKSFRQAKGPISPAFILFLVALLALGGVTWMWLDSVQKAQMESARLMAQNYQRPLITPKTEQEPTPAETSQPASTDQTLATPEPVSPSAPAPKPVAAPPPPPPPAAPSQEVTKSRVNTLIMLIGGILLVIIVAYIVALRYRKSEPSERPLGAISPTAMSGAGMNPETRRRVMFFGFLAFLLVLGGITWVWLDRVQKEQLASARMLAQSAPGVIGLPSTKPAPAPAEKVEPDAPSQQRRDIFAPPADISQAAKAAKAEKDIPLAPGAPKQETAPAKPVEKPVAAQPEVKPAVKQETPPVTKPETTPAVVAKSVEDPWIIEGWDILDKYGISKALNRWDEGLEALPEDRLVLLGNIYQRFQAAESALRKIGKGYGAFISRGEFKSRKAYYVLAAPAEDMVKESQVVIKEALRVPAVKGNNAGELLTKIRPPQSWDVETIEKPAAPARKTVVIAEPKPAPAQEPKPAPAPEPKVVPEPKPAPAPEPKVVAEPKPAPAPEPKVKQAPVEQMEVKTPKVATPTEAKKEAAKEDIREDGKKYTELKPLPDKIKRAERMVKDGKYSEAVEALQPIFAQPPLQWEAYFLMGSAYLGEGNLKQAAEYLDQGIARNGKSPELLVQRAIVEQQKGSNLQALKFLKEAEKYGAGLPEVQLNLGYSNDALDNREDAAKAYRLYLSLTEGKPEYVETRRGVLKRLTELGY